MINGFISLSQQTKRVCEGWVLVERLEVGAQGHGPSMPKLESLPDGKP